MATKLKRGDEIVFVEGKASLEKALADGWEIDGPVALQDPVVGPITVTPEAAETALVTASPESTESVTARNVAHTLEQDYGSGLDQVQAFGEAGADMLTLGGYSALSRAADAEEGVRLRREVNPKAAFTGALTGGVAGSLLGAGAFARAAGTLTKSTGVLRIATAGALEGATFGAGQGLSRAMLSEDPLTVESVAGSIGTEALLGGAIGFGIGGSAHLLGKGLQKGAARWGDAVKKHVNPLVFDDVDDVLRVALDTPVPPAKTPAPQAFPKRALDTPVPPAKTPAPQTFPKRALDPIRREADALFWMLGTDTAQAKNARSAISGWRHATKILKESDSLTTGDLRTVRDKLAKLIDAADTAGYPTKLPDALAQIDELLAPTAAPKPTPATPTPTAAPKPTPATPTPKPIEMPDLSRKALKKLSNEEFASLVGKLDEIPASPTLLDDLAARATPDQLDEVMNLKDDVILKAFGGEIDATTDLAKFVRNTEALRRVEGGLANTVKRVVKEELSDVAEHPGRALLTLGLMALDPSLGLGTVALRGGWNVIKALAKRSPHTQKAVESAVKGIVSGGAKAKHAVVPMSSQTGRLMESLFETKTDPEAVRERIAKPLRQATMLNPGATTAIIDKQMEKLDFLAERMPLNPFTEISPYHKKWKPSPHEERKFARYIHYADNPAAAIESLSLEGKEVITELYPSIYETAQEQIIDSLADGKTLDIETRKRVSRFFDIPVDSLTSGPKIQLLQANYEKFRQEQQQQPSGTTPTGTVTPTKAQQLTER